MSIEGFIPRIYDAALEPEAWPDLVRDIGDSFGACNFLTRESVATFGDGEYWTHDFDRNLYETAPEDIWRPEGSRLIRFLMAAPLARPFDRRACMPDGEIGHDPIGRHFIGPDVFHIVFSPLHRDEDAHSYLMIGRPRLSRDFDGGEIERIGVLTDHLGRAMRTHSALAASRSRSAGLAAAMDALAFGLLLVDERLRVVHANRAAERMLEAGDGIRLRHGQLRLAAARAQSRLENAARRLAGTQPDFGEARLMAPRPSHALPWTIDVIPALGDGPSSLAPLARLLLIIRDPEARLAPLSPARLAVDLDLTAAEARIAAAAGQALPLGEVAERAGVSPNTVKTHLRSIYGKLGVGSQAQLVRLLMARLPPCRDAREQTR